MFRLAADENLHGEIYKRLRSQIPDLDIVRIQDTDISGSDDETMLEWVAFAERILLTHDKRTIVPIFSDALDKAKPVPAVFVISNKASINLVLNDLQMIIACSTVEEWNERITYLPL